MKFLLKKYLIFKKLKEKLPIESILQLFDFNKPFVFVTEHRILQSVLSQGVVGYELPIVYASKSRSKAEINY